MIKGGYKIVDFKGNSLSDTAVTLTGIYNQIVDDYNKPIMVSGVSISGELQDDAYAGVQEKTAEDLSKSVELTVYGGVITVTEDDEVSFELINNASSYTKETWKIKKYSDGTVECWGVFSQNTSIATSWGNLYTSAKKTISFPTGLFTEIPIVNMFITGSNTAFPINAGSTTKNGIDVFLARGIENSDTVNYDVNVHLIGIWK